MDRNGQLHKENKVLMEKENVDQSAETTELTLPEKLCRFYVERPKLAFGIFVYTISYLHQSFFLVFLGEFLDSCVCK